MGPPEEAETKSHTARICLPFQLKPGRYDMFLSVGTKTGTPRIALPLEGHDRQRRYRIGTIRVIGDEVKSGS